MISIEITKKTANVLKFKKINMNKKILNIAILLALLAFASSSHAQGTNLASMFSNAVSSIEQVLDLVQYSGYLIGLFLIIGAAYKLAQLGQGDGRITVKTPLVMFLVGVSIFALTGSVAIMTETLAMGSGPGDLLAPSASGMDATMSQALQGVMLFIRLVGYIAFIRGFLLLNQYGQGKEGVLGKGLIHIFGGVAAINVGITAQILANTFAPGVPLPF